MNTVLLLGDTQGKNSFQRENKTSEFPLASEFPRLSLYLLKLFLSIKNEKKNSVVLLTTYHPKTELSLLSINQSISSYTLSLTLSILYNRQTYEEDCVMYLTHRYGLYDLWVSEIRR
jgi:hypothetical protein